MKKFSIELNIVLIAVVLLLSFKPSGDKTKTVSNSAFNSCYDCTDDKFYGETVSDVVQNVARYKGTHWKKIINASDWGWANGQPMSLTKPKIKILDSRACWFPLDTLKKFICLIEKYSSENKQQKFSSSELGIRFYYAVYPKNLDGDPNYRNHHTLIMVPTFKDKGNENTDFDPRYMYDSSADSKHASLSNLYFNAPRTKILHISPIMNSTLDNGMYKNQGQLCPPYCPSSLNVMESADNTYQNGLPYSDNQPRDH